MKLTQKLLQHSILMAVIYYEAYSDSKYRFTVKKIE